MKWLHNIREFFWPLLEKEAIERPKETNLKDITVDKKYLEKTLQYAIDCYDAEIERNKTVEGKSSLFIGTISVITSVIIGVTSVLVKSSAFNLPMTILVFLLFILTIYMSRTVWFSIQALERKHFHSLSIDEFITVGKKGDEYYKAQISSITNKIRKNSIVINSKVDSMTMAQEYFKRAIVIVTLYSFTIFLVFLSKSELDFNMHASNLITLVNKVKIGGWNVIVIYLISITSLIVGISALRKKK